MINILASELNTECMELQTVWNNAIQNMSLVASQTPTIPQYNSEQLSEITKCIKDKPKLPLVFEQMLQNYLNNTSNDGYKHENVLLLLDIAITISLNTTTLNDKLSHKFVINLLSTYCEYLSCDELEIIVFYLTNRTKLLFKLSANWKSKLQSNNKNTANLELPILKFCNKVLFRLNLSANNIAKRGQFLIFMSNFVDIDSRSGQNFLGQFHLENMTVTDDMNESKESDDIIGDKKLYIALWGLQNIFNDPRRVGSKMNEARFAAFRLNLDLVLESFKKNVIDMDEAMGHYKTITNIKHSSCGSGKYLTSYRLFNKEFHNPSFRRYILVQTLIFLKSHSVKTKSEHPKLTPLDKFKEADKEWLLSKHIQIINEILPNIPPEGDKFAKFIANILARDENWLLWKYNKKDSRCNNLKRELPANMVAVSEEKAAPPRKRRKIKRQVFGSLESVFGCTPNVFQSRWNNVSLNKKGKGLAFLKDYQLIDFKEKLQDRLDFLVQEKNNKLLLCDEKQIFSNLRIMRDLHHAMFNELCPMANNPEPKTFKTEFLLNAMKFTKPKERVLQNNENHDNNTNKANGYHSNSRSKHSKSKKTHKR